MGGELKKPKTEQKVRGLTRKFNFNNLIGMVLTVCILGLIRSRPTPLFFKGGGVVLNVPVSNRYVYVCG